MKSQMSKGEMTRGKVGFETLLCAAVEQVSKHLANSPSFEVAKGMVLSQAHQPHPLSSFRNQPCPEFHSTNNQHIARTEHSEKLRAVSEGQRAISGKIYLLSLKFEDLKLHHQRDIIYSRCKHRGYYSKPDRPFGQVYGHFLLLFVDPNCKVH